MSSLTFVFQSTLLAPLVEFITSSSGHVEPRQGVALGWLGSVVAGLAVVFGTADRTQTDDCHGIPEGPGLADNCESICTSAPCSYDNEGKPIKWYQARYCHSEIRGCRLGGSFCSSC